MEKIRKVSLIIQEGNGGIESVSKFNTDASVVCLNNKPKKGILSSQYGALFLPVRVCNILKYSDVIMTNLPVHHMVFSFFNIFFKKKHICIEHGPWVHAIGAKTGLWMALIYQVWLKISSVTIVCVSKDLYALYNLIRTNNVYIPNAIKKTIRGGVNQTNNIRFVYGGRFDYQKDTELAIKSFIEYVNKRRESSKQITLDLYGTGIEEAYLKEKYSSHDNITFKGHCASLSDVLKNYDICILTSRFEGLPGIALEALSAGCKVVCSPFLTGLMELNTLSSVFISDLRSVESIADCIEQAVIYNQTSDNTYEYLDKNYSRERVNKLYNDVTL